MICVYNGNAIKFFLNGQLVATSNFSGSINSQNNLLAFSLWDNPTLPNTPQRSIDDIGIWNRALTQEEITDLYNGCPLPSWVNAPADITLSCAQAAALSPSELAYDNAETGTCAVIGSVTGVITGSSDQCNGGTLTQTWTYASEQTTLSHTQTITVEPAPEAAWVNPPGDITISCDAALSFAPSSMNYTNNGVGGCLISGSVIGYISGSYTECGGTLIQSWTFTDDCGRTLDHTQTITVEPTPIAAWVNAPGDITISCDAAEAFGPKTLSYSNGASGNCMIAGTITGTITANYEECGGTLTQMWTYTDDCGRTIDHSQTITIEPAPIAAWVNPPVDITISCDQATSFAASSINYTNNGLGGCLIEGSVLGTIAGTYTECGGTLTQAWTYTDDCARTIDHQRIITVLPSPAPSWVNAPNDITISCGEAAELAPSYLQYTTAGYSICIDIGIALSTFNADPFVCGQAYRQTWAYTDQCNRTITHEQNITVLPEDTDGDGIPDASDNCDQVENAAQTDTDSDGIGDACDNCLNTANANQADCNNNGIGDACDAPDADCDSIPDTTDNCPDYPNPNQVDLNSNGVGDACETGNKFGINTTQPLSELHVANGSVYLDNPDKGIILKGADGKCYKITVDNGALKLLVVPCPQSN